MGTHTQSSKVVWGTFACNPLAFVSAAICILSILFLAVFAVGAKADPAADDLLAEARSLFGVLEQATSDSIKQLIAQLGQHLFWDERQSASGSIACASCHAASAWGADAEQFSLDARGKRTKRNSQTVFNAMLQSNLRWTGDRESGAHQAEKSLTGSMGFEQAEDVIALLTKFNYEPLFKESFPNDQSPISPSNYAKALEAYQQTLTTPAAFDRYLAGDRNALSSKQKDGLRLFMKIGCADCHSGKLLGGEGLEKFGIYHDYWKETQSQSRDGGLFESTQNGDDKFRFRVSMLRNVEKTGPYFHDGSVASLPEAVRVMAKLQLDRELQPLELELIVSFLTSLTGVIPENYAKPSQPVNTTTSQDNSQ